MADEGPWAKYAVTEKPKVTAMQRASAFPAGVNQGFASLVGMPMDALLNAGNLASAGMGFLQSKVTGTPPWETFNPQPAENVPFTGAWNTKMLNKIPGAPAAVPRPDDRASRFLAASGSAVPAAMSMRPTNLAQAADAMVSTQIPAMTGQTAAEVFPNSPHAQMLGQMGGMLGVSAAKTLFNKPTLQAPSKEELKKEASVAYKDAENTGTVIADKSFGTAKTRIAMMLDKEGLDPTLHPSTTAALKRITDTNGNVTLEKLETLRRIAKDAQSSISPADKRMASKTVDALDDFAENLSPTDLVSGTTQATDMLTKARGLWSRARKADTIQELVDRAETSAPNFSASGMENSLRTEFRALAKNPKKLGMFTAEEQAAIKKVAMGGPVENTMRMLGKFAPTGVVSAGLSSGLGFLAGGPAGAAALPAAGAASRYGAGKMTMNNAQYADQLMRAGPTGPRITTPPISPEQLRAYLIQIQQQNGVLGQ